VRAETDSEALFSGGPVSDPAVLRSLFESTGGFTFTPDAHAAGVATMLAEAEVVPSRGEARRLISGGGLVVNGERVADPAAVPELIGGEWLDVRIGKRRREIGRLKR
jgi:tyrosyl-tRNA synthetase